jgi:NTE family protein
MSAPDVKAGATRRQWLAKLGGVMAGLGLSNAATQSHAAPNATSTSAGTRKKPSARLAVVLGGGSARGFAHIGVIKALEANGIKPDMIVGCSAGSLVGAFWAAGYSGAEMEKLAYQVNESEIIDLISGNAQSKRGLVSGQALQTFVNLGVKGRSMSGLSTPFVAVATKFPVGDLMAFRDGDVGFAVRASCSIPGIFLPANAEGQEYVDGGLISPLPVQTARNQGANVVVAVDVGADDPTGRQNRIGGGMYELILRSFEIMGQALRRQEAQDADIVIRPDVGRISSTDFTARKALIEAGQKAGNLLAPVILAKLQGLR